MPCSAAEWADRAPDSFAGLVAAIRGAPWFSRLGTFNSVPGLVALKDLSAWRVDPAAAHEVDLVVSEEMDWLPSSAAEPDPLGAGNGSIDDELRDRILEVEREVYAALRKAAHPLFRVGAHDFTPAAKGAARYALRMAAKELLTGHRGPWRTIVALFVAGYWPCGRVPNGDLVVL